jgi:tetratricopeptide (TPR) repeat protein
LLRLTFHTPYFAAQVESDSGSGLGSTSTWLSAFFSPPLFLPLCAALLFVVHPVQTQAVTYIVQRMTSLAAMFYLLSCVFYVLARLSMEQTVNVTPDNGGKKKPIAPLDRVKQGLLLTGSVAAAVFAMKTKEIAFTLPFAVILYEVCFFRGSWRKRLLYLLPLLATLPIIPMTILDFGGFDSDLLSDSGRQLPVGHTHSTQDYLLTQFRVIATYLRLLVLPIRQNLDYDYPVYKEFLTPPVLLSFLLLVAILALAVYLFRRTGHSREKQVKDKSGSEGGLLPVLPLASAQPASHSFLPYLRLISFGLFWFFLTLSVESSLIPLADVIMEHRLYLPCFGAATIFSSVLCIAILKFPRTAHVRLVVLIAVLMITGLGAATLQRNHVWGNAIRLWQDVVEKSPNKGRPLNNLAVALEDSGRRTEAIKTLSRAIQADPQYYKSYYNLADLYLVSDQPEKSLPLLETAIRLNPTFTEAYVEVGAALMRSGRFQDVSIFLEQNFDRIKGNAEAHFYLGASYAFQGRRNEAIRELTIISELDPELAANLKGLLR